VPPHRQVRGLLGLDAVDDVQDHLALVDLDVEIGQGAALVVAAPHPEGSRAHSPASSSASAVWYSSGVMYFASSSVSNSDSSSGGIVGTGCRRSRTSPSSSVETRLVLRHCGSMPGASSRVWPPRDSSRSSAAFAVAMEHSSMFCRSSARCHPGL